MEHDTLEDYMTLSGKMEKDVDKHKNILNTAQKRKDCERKALGIVQLFLVRSVNADLFLKSIAYLNPSYFDDIAEERALLLFCGYPLCGKRITKSKTRYKICNKSKKVYDLDEYGNFCSIFCFDAHNHIKSQILDSPLWLRDLEEIPTFNLLSKKNTTCRGTGIDIKIKKSEKSKEFTPISSFAKLSLDDVGDIDISATEMTEKQDSEKHIPRKNSNITKLSTVMENIEEIEDVGDNPTGNEKFQHAEKKAESLESVEKNSGNEETLRYPPKLSHTEEISKTRVPDLRNSNNLGSCQIVEENSKKSSIQKINSVNVRKNNDISKLKDLKSITEKIRKKVHAPVVALIDPLPLNINASEVIHLEHNAENANETKNKKALIELRFSMQDPVTVENTIKNILKKWITLETLMFVHGEQKIKEILDENKLSEHFDKLKISQLEIDQQKKYISICRKLCEQEIFEEKFESLLVENNLRPLPDYKQLKQESKEFNIKVRTFYSGDLYESADKNFGSQTVDKTENNDQEPAFLPLADVNSQNALRHKILSDTLNKSIKLLLDYIKYDSPFVLTEINELIRTFEVDAENIVFKPVIRNYLGLICLRILSLKDSTLCEELRKSEYLELEDSVLKQLPGNKDVLTNCLKLINDVESFVETYVKSTDS